MTPSLNSFRCPKKLTNDLSLVNPNPPNIPYNDFMCRIAFNFQLLTHLASSRRDSATRPSPVAATREPPAGKKYINGGGR
jgi:hypothetical protein